MKLLSAVSAINKKMLAGKKNLLLILLGVTVLVLTVALLHGFGYAFYPSRLPLTFASDVSIMDNGEFLVVDNGNKRVVRGHIYGSYNLIINAGKNTFSNASGIAMDEAGNIYINDLTWSINGMDVVSERILRFDRRGLLREVLLERDYAANGQKPQKQLLFGPYCVGGSCYAVETSAYGFTLIDLQTGKPPVSISHPDANLNISSFDTDGDTVWFTGKNGAVYEASREGVNVRYYERSHSFDDASLPWRVAASQNMLFLADIGRREVISVNERGTENTVFALAEGHPDIEEFAFAPIYFALDASDNYLTATISNDILIVKNMAGTSTLCSETQFSLDSSVVWLKWVALATLLLAACTLAAIIITVLILIIRHGVWSTGSRISVLIMAIIIITLVIVLPITYNSGLQLYVDNSLAQLSSVVQMGGYLIDAEALKRVDSPGDYMNSDYRSLMRSMDELINKQYTWNDRLYCMLYAYKDGILYTPAFLDGTGGSFYPYDYGIEDDTLEAVFNNGEIVTTEVALDNSGSWMYVQGPVFDSRGNVAGAVEVGLDIYSYQAYYRNLYVSIILAVISAGVILQMIIMQVLKMTDFLEKRKLLLQTRPKLLNEPVEFIGPTVFLLFFAFNLTTSFLPIYAAKLYEPLPGWPREFMEALPLSANLLAIVVGSALAGGIIRRGGITSAIRLGFLVIILPYCSLGFIHEYTPFLLLFALAGLGFGVVQNAVTTYIAGITDAEEQSMGFSYFNSALFIGFNCGTVVGAVLAESMGQSMVFSITGVCFLLPAILLVKLMRGQKPRKGAATGQKGALSIFSFFGRPAILLLFLLALTPYAISGHFMFYFMPIYGEGMGLTETAIGQLFLANGLCVLAFSSLLTRVANRYLRNYQAITLSMLLVAAAFAYFAWRPSIQSVIIVLVLLGISSAFGAAALRAHFTQLPDVKRYGYERSMSIFATVENGGDTIGPIVFSFVLAGAIQKNLLVVAIAITVLIAVFAFTARRAEKNNAPPEEGNEENYNDENYEEGKEVPA